MTSVLFVCLGNICRSPAAEAVFRKFVKTAGMNATVDSAGTSNWHQGNPPYDPMIEGAKLRGYDLSDLRARQFRPSDFDKFDLIIAMDNENLDDIERLRPEENVTPARLFLSYVPDLGITEVPDPYCTRDIDGALDLIEKASDGLLAELR